MISYPLLATLMLVINTKQNLFIYILDNNSVRFFIKLCLVNCSIMTSERHVMETYVMTFQM